MATHESHESPGSTAARRQMGRKLTQLRKSRNMRQDDVAAGMECSQAKLWRLETGKNSVQATSRDIRHLCEVYGASEEQTADLLALHAQTKIKGWWHDYSAVPNWFQLYVGLEEAAKSLREYHTELITGVLQTPGYATAVVRADASAASEEEVRQLVEVRLKRSNLLTRRVPAPPQFDVILNESVLRRPVGGPAVMAEQLRHLAELSELPNVTIRVLSFSAGMHPGALAAGSFVILDFYDPDEPTQVYCEALTGAAYLHKKKEAERHIWAFDGISDQALDPAASRELLIRTAKEHES